MSGRCMDFDVAHAAASDWKVATDALLPISGSGRGQYQFSVRHRPHAGHLADIADRLIMPPRWRMDRNNRIGILSTAGEASMNRPSRSWSAQCRKQRRPFGPVRESTIELDLLHRDWIESQHPTLTLVHADPRHPPIGHLVEALAENVPHS